MDERGRGDHDRDTTFDGAFDRLFRRAYGVALRILHVREDAEDVAIETLSRAALRWPSIASEPDGWITTVAANRSIDLWRRRRRAPPPEVRLSGDPGAAEERLDLVRAVSRLPRRQREAVTMRYVLDLSEADTAAMLGCTAGTVKQHLSRALRALRGSGLVLDDTADPARAGS